MSNNNNNNNIEHHQVIIVGSGLAGLTCAHTLNKQETDFVILEANPVIGGRVRGLRGFVDWKVIDAGGEFVHGDETTVFDFAIKNNLTPRLLYTWAQGDLELDEYPVAGGWAMYYFGGTRELVSTFNIDKETKRANNLLWGISDKEEMATNKSVEQYLIENRVSMRDTNLLEAGYANTLCNSLNGLSLKGTQSLEKLFAFDGHGDFRLEEGMCAVPETMAQDFQDKIYTESPVVRIDYTSGLIQVQTKNNMRLTCEHLVIGVPVTQLQNNSIEFIPPLPEEKSLAIQKIKMHGAMKLLIKVSYQFWPLEAHGIVCADCPIPEIWFDTPERLGIPHKFAPYVEPRPRSETGPFLISGFCCAGFAERLNKVSDDEKIKIFVNQLNEMFGGKNICELMKDPRSQKTRTTAPANPPEPASQYFIEGKVINWCSEPYINGGYSSPTNDNEPELRDAYARPVLDRLFWCGEATQRSFMSVHAAMNSGQRAAAEVLGYHPRSKF